MKRVLNISLSVLGIVAVIAISVVIIASKPLPEGQEGEKAEALTDKMLSEVNLPAWESIRYLRWKFRGERSYVWDRWYNLAEICYADKRVLINLNTLEGKVWDGGNQIEGADKREELQRAWEYWCNDSFWLNPFIKVRDEGVTRAFVELDNGNDGLLITFSQGGVTPGDSYLFELNEQGLPLSWRMWVSILPVKGLQFEIIEWQDTDGANIAVKHQIGSYEIEIEDVVSGDHHSDLGLHRDPFTDF